MSGRRSLVAPNRPIDQYMDGWRGDGIAGMVIYVHFGLIIIDETADCC